MTKLQQLINTFMLKAGQELPGHPLIPNDEVCALRLRLIGEELMELADALGFHIQLDNFGKSHLIVAPAAERHLSNIHRLPNMAQDLVAAADAFSDINYVSVGGQSAFGIDGEPIDLEVHESNMSKFIDGHRDEGGKWIKGPSTREPNIAPLLRAQGAEG